MAKERPTVEKLEHKQLFAGEVSGMIRVSVADGTYRRGQVLECVVTDGTPATTYGKAAGELKTTNDYVICNEDFVATGGTETVSAIKYGYFNKELVSTDELGETVVTETGIDVLRTNGIFLEDVKKA